MTHDTVLTNPQVGKVFAFQSVAMNIGTLAWPVFLYIFVFKVFINIFTLAHLPGRYFIFFVFTVFINISTCLAGIHFIFCFIYGNH